jgi:hypothetical protein
MQLPAKKTVQRNEVVIVKKQVEDLAFLTVKFKTDNAEASRSVSTTQSNTDTLVTEVERLISEVIEDAERLVNLERTTLVYNEVAEKWLPQFNQKIQARLTPTSDEDAINTAVNEQIQATTGAINDSNSYTDEEKKELVQAFMAIISSSRQTKQSV